MEMVTQEAYFRQRVLNHAAKHGVTAAAIQYHMSRKTVHKWKKRYDGTVESLQDLPRTPHHFPRQQTAAELKLVKRFAKKCKGDPLLGYENASKHGYSQGRIVCTAKSMLMCSMLEKVACSRSPTRWGSTRKMRQISST